MSARGDEVVRLDNVGLRYGTDREILSNVSFTLFPGRFYFLTGASGAGKTSLLRALMDGERRRLADRDTERTIGLDSDDQDDEMEAPTALPEGALRVRRPQPQRTQNRTKLNPGVAYRALACACICATDM